MLACVKIQPIPQDLSVLSKRGARKVMMLQRRMLHLATRISIAEQQGQHLSYDNAELCALQWVIRRLLELESVAAPKTAQTA